MGLRYVYYNIFMLCVLFLLFSIRVSVSEKVVPIQSTTRSRLSNIETIANVNVDKNVESSLLKNNAVDGIPFNKVVFDSEFINYHYFKAKDLKSNEGLSNITTNGCHRPPTENKASGEHVEKERSAKAATFEFLQNIFVVFKGCKIDKSCYQKKILNGLNRILNSDNIQISDGIILVKEDDVSVYREAADDDSPFLVRVARKVIQILETHALRVRLGVMQDNVEQGRIGHHGYKHAFPLMVGSFMLMAAFMVPMGFQFLAVIGGKALVLSQIALVMAMGGSLQRYFGGGAHPATPGSNLGGIVQHDYYLRDDLRPWKREGSEGAFTRGASQHQHSLAAGSQLDQQHLQGLMYYQEN